MGLNAVILIPQTTLTEASEQSSVFVLSWLVMHGLTALVALAFIRRFDYRFYIVVAASIYVMASAVWSPSPKSSFPYAALLAGNFLASYLIAISIGRQKFIELLMNMTLLMVFMGISGFLIGYGQVLYLDPHDRQNLLGLPPIRGLFPHKILGSLYTCIGMSLSLAILRGWKRMLAVLLCLTFVVLSGSSTGLILVLISFAAWAFMQVMAAFRLSGVGALMIFALVAAPLSLVSIYFFADILEVLGRDPTLTGRTILWQWGIDTWLKKPLFGWGFHGYFASSDAEEVVSYIGSFRNYDVPHFHQSYIQTAVDLGLVGVIPLIGIILAGVAAGYKGYIYQRDAHALGIFIVLMVMIWASTSMFIFFNYNYGTTIFIVTTFLCMLPAGTRQPKLRRIRSQAPPMPIANSEKADKSIEG